jgi:hypothetical protein
MPHTIVIQGGKSVVNNFTKGSHLYSYHLNEQLNFTEPHYARLLYLGGASDSCFVFADFVERQNINGELHPFLGCSAKQGNINSWVRLSSNHIPTCGYIQLRPTSPHRPLSATSTHTIIIEIASESFVHGAKSQDKL